MCTWLEMGSRKSLVTFARAIFIMNRLLVAATAQEIKPFLEHHRESGGTGNLDVLVTGVGLVATTYALTRQFSLKKPGMVIQAGIAGCFDKKIPLGSVVAIDSDMIADQAVIENKKLKTTFDLGLCDPDQLPFTGGWLINPHKTILRKLKLKAVSGISVNHVSTDKTMIRLYQAKFKPSVETMEGAALHYTCRMENIPFLQVRSISNYVGERNKKNWTVNEAIINLNNTITSILEKY